MELERTERWIVRLARVVALLAVLLVISVLVVWEAADVGGRALFVPQSQTQPHGKACRRRGLGCCHRACPAPTGLTSSRYSLTSAQLEWNPSTTTEEPLPRSHRS